MMCVELEILTYRREKMQTCVVEGTRLQINGRRIIKEGSLKYISNELSS